MLLKLFGSYCFIAAAETPAKTIVKLQPLVVHCRYSCVLYGCFPLTLLNEEVIGAILLCALTEKDGYNNFD